MFLKSVQNSKYKIQIKNNQNKKKVTIKVEVTHI